MFGLTPKRRKRGGAQRIREENLFWGRVRGRERHGLQTGSGKTEATEN